MKTILALVPTLLSLASGQTLRATTTTDQKEDHPSPSTWTKVPLPASFHQVKPHDYLDESSGFEQVDIHASLPMDPTELTDAELEYMTAAVKFTFDETSPQHSFHSKYAYLDEIEVEEGRMLQQMGHNHYHLLYYVQWGCTLCPDDDDNFPKAVEEAMLENHHHDDKHHKSDPAWANAWCTALQESGFEAFQDATDCVIELPPNGVHASSSAAAAAKDFQNENEQDSSSWMAKVQRVLMGTTDAA